MATNTLFDDAVHQSEQPSPSHQSKSLDSKSSQRSSLEHFIDSFFQERNIRWMLVVGATIVFGSSLMLVTREWSDWPTAVQFFTILGYTAAIFGFAQLGRHRLGLLATAKVLDLLTLLLLPVSFLSLSWLTLHSADRSSLATFEALGLLIPATLLTWFASTRILDCWLRGRQTTFVVSYVILCISGALPELENSWLKAAVTILLWLVMTAGVVKVNRHVFWLVEEFRTPRIFGFLPIGLLGLQFILLMATKTCRTIPFEWIGLVCTAVAATILLTGRSIANVYRQRTGDLVRPLPWNIMVPLLVGTILTIIGVLISFHRFSYFDPMTVTVVPTTIVAAGLMLMVAQETKHRGFVWAGLVLVAIAYQTTPTLVTDLVKQFKESAEHALAEEKLPIAFYGLTYLPLLLVFAAGSHYFSLRNRFYVSKPLQHFATAVAFALFAISFMHPKAVFLVASVNTLLFLVFASMFRDRRYAIPFLAALVLAVGAWIPFGNSLGWFELSPYHAITSLAFLAALLVTTRFPDRWIHRIPHMASEDLLPSLHCDGRPTHFCRTTGLLLVFGLAILAVGLIVDRFGSAWSIPQLIAIGTILLSTCLSAIRVRHYLAGLGFWLLAMIGLASWILGLNYDALNLITIATLATTTVSLLVSFYVLVSSKGQRYQTVLSNLRKELGIDSDAWTVVAAIPEGKDQWIHAIKVFTVPLGDLCFTVILALTAFYHLPTLVLANAMNLSMLTPSATSVSLLWLMTYGLVLKNPIASVATFAMLPLWSTAILITFTPSLLSASMLPLVWSFVAGLALFAVERMDATGQPTARLVGRGWLVAIIAMSFLYSDLPLRCAGLVSLGLLTSFLRHRLELSSRTLLAIVGNLQVLLLSAHFGGIRGWLPIQLNEILASEAVACLLPVVGLSILFFDRRWTQLDSIASKIWTYVLRCAFVLGALSCFGDLRQETHEILMVVCAILTVSIAEFCEAVRYRRESQVWSGFCAIAFGGIYLAYHGVLTIGAGASQFAMLAISISSLFIIERFRSHVRLEVFVRPLRAIGLALPGIVVASAVAQECMRVSLVWNGFNTLALLTAACIYFRLGLVTKQRRYYLAAGAILNITLALLWHTMQLYDFQLYLVPLGLSIIGVVELLRKEIPSHSHDPIRYVGALTILVSPIFEILNGSWWHLFSLMVLSVLVILLSIGLRLRVLVYTGSAFLLADMVAMVVRTTIDHPSLLWVGGLGLGVAVITLAAVCERHREQLLSRIRMLSNELAAWH